MKADEFAAFLAGVASRLRHDLKGGLITLRMGLEALPEEEDLKPLLLERAQHLETLSDKLVLLLRMGNKRAEPVRLSALLVELRSRVNDRHPQLELTLPSGLSDYRPRLDGDALVYALVEVAENAALAGATSLVLVVSVEDGTLALTATDNGSGPEPGDADDPQAHLAPIGVSRWGRSGLGLAIAQRCALAHDGELRMSAARPQGMAVTLFLRESPP